MSNIEATTTAPNNRALATDQWLNVLSFLDSSDVAQMGRVSTYFSQLAPMSITVSARNSERSLALRGVESAMEAIGLREGLESTESKLLQEGFDQGFVHGSHQVRSHTLHFLQVRVALISFQNHLMSLLLRLNLLLACQFPQTFRSGVERGCLAALALLTAHGPHPLPAVAATADHASLVSASNASNENFSSTASSSSSSSSVAPLPTTALLRLAELTRDAKAVEIAGYYAPGGEGHTALTAAAAAAAAASTTTASAAAAYARAEPAVSAAAREADRAVHTRPGIPVSVLSAVLPPRPSQQQQQQGTCAETTAPATGPVSVRASGHAGCALAGRWPGEAAALVARVEAALAAAAADADAGCARAILAAIEDVSKGGAAGADAVGREVAVPLPLPHVE